MTESEWNSCNNPQQMIEWLRSRITARKLRLFGVACCRHIWHLLSDDRSRKAVELAEAVADDRDMWIGLQDSLARAREEVVEAVYGPMTGTRAELENLLADERAACLLVFFLVWRMEQEAFRDTTTIIRYTTGRLSAEGRHLCHSDLIRDLFGPLPFREVYINLAWRTWNGGTVQRIAQTIYAERELPSGTLDNSLLAVLADALLDAGCDNEEVLAHCRGMGPHVRGCWVLDLLLGKN
jgi:hypothetical protein